MDIVSVLGSVSAIVIAIFGKLPKDWLYPEKEFEKKMSLAEERAKEEHSKKLTIVLNNHYRKIGTNDNDFEDVLTDYSTTIQKHCLKFIVYQKCLSLTKLCFDLLLYSLFMGIFLLIASFIAISINNKWFCGIVFTGVIVLVISQIVIICSLRKIKKEADNKVDFNRFH